MVYRSKDSRFEVELPDNIVADLVTYIKPAGRRETGGIILGTYNESRNRAIIEMITAAPSDSKSGYTWFQRGVSGLQKLIVSMWKRQTYYLGEWHFHPYALPIPSGTDINQMDFIAKSRQYNCPEPILLIIGGTPADFEIAMFVVLTKSDVIEVSPEATQ